MPIRMKLTLKSVLTLVILGCLMAGTGTLESASAQTVGAPPMASPVRKLPMVTALLKGKSFQLEVALTTADLQRGLMYRASLGSNEGMMFPFTPPRRVDFWMKNCLIPLDMIFFRSGQIVNVVHSAPPCRQEPCPTYASVYPVDLVLEVPAGTASALSLQVGDGIQIFHGNQTAQPIPHQAVPNGPGAVPEAVPEAMPEGAAF